jgi:hypothetical protein
MRSDKGIVLLYDSPTSKYAPLGMGFLLDIASGEA